MIRDCMPSFLALAFLSGCAVPFQDAQDIRFSPDGHYVVAAYAEGWRQFTIDSDVIYQRAGVSWCPAEYPARTKKVDLGATRTPARFVISPDGRHLAAFAAGRLRIIDLSTGKSWELGRPGEICSSAAWPSDNEVVYAVRTNRRGYGADMALFRQRIDMGGPERQQIAKPCKIDVAFYGDSLRQLEWWSPNGRWVVLLTDLWGRFQLLDAGTGKIQAIGSANSFGSERVAWKRDSSAVFCMCYRYAHRPGIPEPEALLLEPDQGKTTDLSDAYRQAFGDKALIFEELWSGDDRYIVANALNTSGFLISPKPWKLIPIRLQTGQDGEWIYGTDAPDRFVETVSALSSPRGRPDLLIDSTGKVIGQAKGVPHVNGAFSRDGLHVARIRSGLHVEMLTMEQCLEK